MHTRSGVALTASGSFSYTAYSIFNVDRLVMSGAINGAQLDVRARTRSTISCRMSSFVERFRAYSIPLLGFLHTTSSLVAGLMWKAMALVVDERERGSS